MRKLEPLREKKREELDQQPYLKDIVERNLEVAIQCSIDIANRIICVEDAQRPKDYYEAFLILGSIEVLPQPFAKKLAPMAGFRNVLVHTYVDLDWDLVYEHLLKLEDLYGFDKHIRKWMKDAASET